MSEKHTYIALICGVGAALSIGLFLWGIAHSVRARENDVIQRFGGRVVEVCVAKTDLKAGHRLAPQDIVTKKWPASLLPQNPVLKKNMLALRDRRISRPMLKGEPFSQAKVNKNANRFDAIVPGYTAVTLETNAVRALGGEITVGMDVTVMATSEARTAKVLVQKAEVLSSNRTSGQQKQSSLLGGPDKGEIAWVTLAIPDEKVKEVVAASVTDSTYIVLPKDVMATVDGVSIFSDEETQSSPAVSVELSKANHSQLLKSGGEQ